MSKVISFMHISLDGFVAGPQGEMDWIEADAELFDYIGKRIKRGNTALYGRVTFDMMQAYWLDAGDKPTRTRYEIEHSQWYKQAHKVVISNTMKDKDFTNTTIIGDNLTENINELKSRVDEEILLFGSPTATHSLIQQDLIDGYWLFVNPIILGRGIPLFANVTDKIRLNLLPTTSRFAGGVTELNYSVEKQYTQIADGFSKG
ncbi:dihydrofolate reductase [Segetibacter sp. 3557_3]|uniref:dihydrofolate reductase family protein n=1 Tax=Segetibacter sp. 3557_3 TaxID=2547429 RepID=UPI001058ABD6|nr:dihydrofolate reductase family protein [Segetibacter sp. 3557_3]TDH26932.1 dihydrofolate reductase [Segetibacter sp. 3557_3]